MAMRHLLLMLLVVAAPAAAQDEAPDDPPPAPPRRVAPAAKPVPVETRARRLEIEAQLLELRAQEMRIQAARLRLEAERRRLTAGGAAADPADVRHHVRACLRAAIGWVTRQELERLSPAARRARAGLYERRTRQLMQRLADDDAIDALVPPAAHAALARELSTSRTPAVMRRLRERLRVVTGQIAVYGAAPGGPLSALIQRSEKDPDVDLATLAISAAMATAHLTRWQAAVRATAATIRERVTALAARTRPPPPAQRVSQMLAEAFGEQALHQIQRELAGVAAEPELRAVLLSRALAHIGEGQRRLQALKREVPPVVAVAIRHVLGQQTLGRLELLDAQLCRDLLDWAARGAPR